MRNRLLIVCLALLMLTACQSMPWNKSSQPPAEGPGSNDTLDAKSLDSLDNKAAAPAPATDSGLQLSSETRFKDIPLPVNVKEDLERTYVFESANLQLGRMVYTTRADINDLSNFYLRECPAAEWKLQNVLQAEGVSLLFTKPGKHLQINVQNLGVGQGRRLIITLTPDASSGQL